METVTTNAQTYKDKMNEFNVKSLLSNIGEDVDRDGLKNTPTRFLNAIKEMTSGYVVNEKEFLDVVFEEDSDEIIIVKDVEFTSLCEHHILPFFGVCHVAYIPSCGKVVGLSKIPRLVSALSRRLQTQERLTKQIATSIMGAEKLKPVGVAVVCKSIHTCMRNRGARQPSAEMVTSCMLGAFRNDEKARQEFFSLIK